MRFDLRASSLVPSGFVVEGVKIDLAGAVITVRAMGKTNQCPRCGAVSARIHSRYRRQLAALRRRQRRHVPAISWLRAEWSERTLELDAFRR